MANYDRQILVPYLRDVCCAEMLCRKLEQDISNYQVEANQYTQWANQSYEDPPKPNPENYSGGDESAQGGMIVGVVILVIGCCLLAVPILGIPAILFGLLMIWVGSSENSNAREKRNKQYEEALEKHNKQAEQNKQWRESRPEWGATAQRLREQERKASKDLQDARTMRDKLYAVNIIPSRYRTIHAVYYLYDFFSTCRETDLEKTIQTMLLDEIIQRMDKLIVQNQEILLNQRRQIALQESQNRAIANNHREKMRQIVRMERNQELQLDYQRMIECNQEVTNFFLAAEYIEKNR